MPRRIRKPSKALKARLQVAVLQGRRETIYRMLEKKHGGMVPCFVCGKHVKKGHATLEHKIPRSRGGTDDMDNLSISHNVCNSRRGNALPEDTEMKTTSHTEHVFNIPGTDIEVELPIAPDSIMDYKEPIVRITDKHVVVGYLAHDDYCENPLESDDFAGHIYEARRHGPTLRQYEEALALGDFAGGKRNPHAVLLDVYEHGQVRYSLSGEGMQCQWDTARGGAVFVPSSLMLDDIQTAADPEARVRELAAQAAEQYTDWCNGNCFCTVVASYDLDGTPIDHDTCGGYVGADDAYECLQQSFGAPEEVEHG